MFDILVWITENGLQHFIPLLILIGIFVFLAEKVNTQVFSWSVARDYFFRKADEAYARLREDPKAWKNELEERAEWDVTLMDGLDKNEE